MANLSPLQILRRDKEAAARYAEQASKERARQVLERAQLELNQRIQQAIGRGLEADTFTVQQMQAALAQVRAVLKGTLLPGMQANAIELGKAAAEQAAQSAVEYIERSEQLYRGSTKQLPFDTASLIDTAVAGASSTVLRRIATNPQHPAQAGVLARYGANVIGEFEGSMQQRLLQGKSWAEAQNDLTAASPFLQGKPAFWSERILRTETMNVHNAAAQQSLEQVHDIVGGMLKILSATFDQRTGADSIAVHGQIRRPNEPFHSWFGAYMHPPNRPNDREVVVPHNMAWPIPAELEPRSDGEVAARWALEGRKGSPPPRPNMSTVDRELIGKPDASQPMADATPPEVLKPPAEAPEREQLPAPEPRVDAWPAPGDGIIPSLDALPIPPPALLSPPLNILAEQIGPQGGSNPGGVYRGSDGVDRYVKFYADPTQAAGEHLANQIYEKLGLGALKSTLFDVDGKTAYASEMIQGATPISKKIDGKGSMKLAEKALDGFAADVLLANWDAVGLTLDNLLVAPGNKIIRVDNGGSLLSRARAGRKSQAALNNPAAEWEGFFNPSVNPSYTKLAKAAGVFGPEDMAQRVIKSIDKIDKLAKKKGGWAAFVDEHAPMLNPTDRDQIVDMLTTRTGFLRQKRDELRAKLKSYADEANAPRRPIDQAEIEKARKTYQQRVDPARDHFVNNYDYHRVVRDYTSSGYRAMNETLYKTPEQLKAEGVTTDELKARMEKNLVLAKALQEAKQKGLVAEGVVYRGVKAWPGLMQELEQGEFSFGCFASTSTKAEKAKDFAGGEDGYAPVLFRLRQKTAVPLEAVTSVKSEYEALLPPGVRFRVIKKERWGSGNGIIVDAEEIDE